MYAPEVGGTPGGFALMGLSAPVLISAGVLVLAALGFGFAAWRRRGGRRG